MIKKLNNQGLGVAESVIALLVVGLIIAAGLYVLKNHSQSTGKTQGGSKSITVFGEKISPASCDQTKSLVKQELSGDICYTGKFSIDGEKVSYIRVDQSASYLAKQASECTLDCGGSIPLPGNDYIVRANGAIEFASAGWVNQAEPYVDYITGCGTGKFSQFDRLKDQGKFVKDGNKIAIAVSFKNAKLVDDYGNQCDVDAKLLSYTADEGQLIKIQNVAVKYHLKDISSCQQQAKPEDCYAAQASMRNDLQLCDKAVDMQYPASGADYCIESLAKRRLDPALCDKLNESQNICRKDTQELKSIFTGKLVVN